MSKTDLSIIIPAYNESKVIREVISDIKRTIINNGINASIIAVNDGSTDNTGEILSSIQDIIILNHPYNKGYGAALKTGIRSADSDYVLIMDADNQHSSEDIFRLYQEKDRYEMVIGARTNVTSIIRSPAKKIINIFASYLAGRKIPDLNSGFRIMKRDFVMDYMHFLPNKFSFTTTITLAGFAGGHSLHYIPIKMKKRKTGKSTIHPVKDTINFFLLLIRTTMLFNPLKVFIPVCIFLIVLGFVFSAYGLSVYGSFPKSASIIFVAGMLTFFFGLVADQISEMRRQK